MDMGQFSVETALTKGSHRAFVPDHQFGRHVVEGDDSDMLDKRYWKAGNMDIYLDHMSS